MAGIMIYAQVAAECAAQGSRLVTVTTHDLNAGLFRRVFTSHPVEYPVHGTKPMPRDAWFDLCVTRAQPFVANAPEAFRALFFDHALIESLGLGSAVNLPVIDAGGQVPGTLNLLAEAGHFTPERLAAYGAILARNRLALLDGMAQG